MLPTHPPLPVETVRDVLGLVRLLWRSAFEERAPDERLGELEEIGRLLRLALKLAKAGPDTLGGRASWMWAEQAVQRLGRLVQDDEQIARAVEHAARRLRRA